MLSDNLQNMQKSFILFYHTKFPTCLQPVEWFGVCFFSFVCFSPLNSELLQTYTTFCETGKQKHNFQVQG